MRKGNTKLKDQCRYMVRRPSEVFLAEGQTPPEPTQNQEELSQEELLKQAVHIPHRPKKDPRELRILDPACGSGHFLLYCFALLLTIYEEAYTDPDLGPKLKEDYPTLEALRRDVPRLILAHNLHGIDIDLRATQIAALALWLRCQRAYGEMGLKQDRPKITKSNIVCAEPMPGEREMLDEFLKTLKKDRLEALIGKVMQVPEGSRVRATESMVESLNELVRLVWDKMQLAGEAGSLLNIEEELTEAVRKGQEEWEEKQPLFRFTEFNLTEQPKESYVRFVPGEGVSFWQRAEALVLEALRDYTRHAANCGRLQRQLFADDAERGFAFIDICQKRFDVVLMNPPFGTPPARLAGHLASAFPDYGNDLLAAFISRGVSVSPYGYVGAISSRTAFYLPTFAIWRARTLFGESHLVLAGDLGANVLDEALVEAFISVIASGSPALSFLPCFRMTRVPPTEKHTLLRSCSQSLQRGGGSIGLFTPLLADIVAIPLRPVVYSASKELHRAFSEGSSVSRTASVEQGLSTKNDFRFLRLVWEVRPRDVGREGWGLIAKGGEYRPFYDDIHLVVNSRNSFSEIKEELLSKYPYLQGKTDWVLHPDSQYFVGGLTYPERTTSSFAPRLLPKDCFFSHVGLGIISGDEATDLSLLGWLLSRPLQLQIELQAGSADAVESGSAARHYSKALIENLRILNRDTMNDMTSQLRVAVEAERGRDRCDETTRMFSAPFLEAGSTGTLKSAARNRYDLMEQAALSILEAFDACESVAEKAFGLECSQVLDDEVRKRVTLLPRVMPPHERITLTYSMAEERLVDFAVEVCGFHRALSKKAFIADRRLELVASLTESHPSQVATVRKQLEAVPPTTYLDFTQDIISYCVGCEFGRWDVRVGLHQTSPPSNGELFSALPACPPGMLQQDDGLPAETVPNGYPLRVDVEGIIPDDPDHPDDIVRRVREVLEVIWKDRAEPIEKEACEILGVKELREYFRKPGKGGFWDDHVSRYSKSRRKAPIYWLLQSSKKNYALWLYYHRLDKDILFKARQNYVEPKIRLEQTRLDSLRSQKTALGAGAKGAKKIDKDIERQEALIGELKDFAEKLERAAKLNFGNPEKLNSAVVYDPDLNDGVVLTIAPLWELVPWKEAKNFWEELLEGKYEWSSMGKLLRRKGLVK